MVVSYDKLWELLYQRKIFRSDLAKEIGVSRNSMAKMKRNEPVSLEILLKICTKLDVDISEIIEFKK